MVYVTTLLLKKVCTLFALQLTLQLPTFPFGICLGGAISPSAVTATVTTNSTTAAAASTDATFIVPTIVICNVAVIGDLLHRWLNTTTTTINCANEYIILSLYYNRYSQYRFSV